MEKQFSIPTTIRCDGIEGLFQFLKDENIITENPFEN